MAANIETLEKLERKMTLTLPADSIHTYNRTHETTHIKHRMICTNKSTRVQMKSRTHMREGSTSPSRNKCKIPRMYA